MKRLTATTATLGATLAFALATPSFADNHGRGGKMLQKLDADKNGAISAEEFVTARTKRFDKADTNGDGQLTKEELAARIEKRRIERRAERMLRRLDLNDDGKVTKAEIENQARKSFAMADRDDSGEIEKDEMRRAKRMMRRGGHGAKHWGKYRDRQRGADDGQEDGNDL